MGPSPEEKKHAAEKRWEAEERLLENGWTNSGMWWTPSWWPKWKLTVTEATYAQDAIDAEGRRGMERAAGICEELADAATQAAIRYQRKGDPAMEEALLGECGDYMAAHDAIREAMEESAAKESTDAE